jgi:very-short-patch-repair endonuclease
LIDAKVLIELEGGLYGNGRHNRAGGYLADIEKYNAASMLGFVVLRLGTGQVDHQHVTEIIDWIKSGVRA